MQNNDQSSSNSDCGVPLGILDQMDAKSVSTVMVGAGETSILAYPWSILPFKVEYPELSEFDVKSIFEGVLCLAEVFYLHGFERPSKKSMRYHSKKGHPAAGDLERDLGRQWKALLGVMRRIASYVKLYPNGWIDYLKYKIVAFYAYFNGQDLPPKPKGFGDDDLPNVILGGVFLGFQKRIKSDPELWSSFVLSILMSKKGMPRASREMVAAAEEKTARHLTMAPAEPVDKEMFFPWCPGFKLSRSVIETELERTVDEFFYDAHYTEDDHYEPFFPSTSANYNWTRSAAGAVAAVVDVIKDIGEYQEPQSHRERPCVRLLQKEGRGRGEMTSHFGDHGREEQARFDDFKSRGGQHVCTAVQYDDSLLREKWVKVMDKLEELAYEEDFRVKPVGLEEALKIRVITKGPPLAYTFLKPLQKWMWRTLKRHRVFRLIGEPVTSELIQLVFKDEVKDHLCVINGDFKASTDNLHSWVSACIVRRLILLNQTDTTPGVKKWSQKHQELFMRSLIHHKFEVDGQWKDQLEGQLMGSITSFVVLCLANAALCRFAMELSRKKEFRLRNDPMREQAGVALAPLLINGDDNAGLYGRDTGRHCWETVTAFGGLTTSVGKTEFGDKDHPVVVINSVRFDLVDKIWREQKYVNLGLVFNKQRSGGRDVFERGYSQLGSIHRELRQGCPERVWPAVSQRFIDSVRPLLEKCPNIPWWAPEYLGGPGLVPDKEVSYLDRCCMTDLIVNGHLRGMRIQREIMTPMWKVDRLVTESIPDADSCFAEVRPALMVNTSKDYLPPPFVEVESEYLRMYGALCVATIFSHPLEKLFSEDDQKEKGPWLIRKINKRILQSNNRAWQKAEQRFVRNDGKVRGNTFRDIPVRSWEDLQYQKCFETKACFRNPLQPPTRYPCVIDAGDQ